MKLSHIILEEVLSFVDETYESVTNINQLSSDILKKVAEENVEMINKTGAFQYLWGIPLNVMSKTGKDYGELNEFIKKLNVYILFQKKEEHNPRGNYSVYLTREKSQFNPNLSREINVYYNYDELKENIDRNIVRTKERGDQYNANDLYFDIFYHFYSTLAHELQHAFDDYRSKSQIFKHEKQDELGDIKSDLNANRKYFNLPSEIWARFTQAMQKVHFYTFDIEGSNITYKMYPMNDVIKDFSFEFKGFKVLSDKSKRNLIRRVAQFWNFEKDKVDRLNAGEKK